MNSHSSATHGVYGIETGTGTTNGIDPEALELAWELIVAANFFTIDAENMQRIASVYGLAATANFSVCRRILEYGITD
jgi:hypothetical protein